MMMIPHRETDPQDDLWVRDPDKGLDLTRTQVRLISLIS